MADANLSGNENRGINNEPVNNKLTKLTTQYTGHYKYASLIYYHVKNKIKNKIFFNLIY